MSASMNLATVDDVKAYLRLTGNDQDTVIEGLIHEASEVIENSCGREFKQKERTEYYDGRGSAWLVVNERPVSSIMEVYDQDSVITFGPLNYTFYPDDGIIRLLVGRFQPGSRNVRVRYTAGYATIPPDLAQACIILVSSWFTGESRDKEDSLPSTVERLLSPYKNWK